MSDRSGALPTLIVIGAQKCGTSALHAYLGAHPEISMSRPKELDFFIAERTWPRGLGWYMDHFDPAYRVRGESSPNYSAFPTWSGVPQRIAEVVPDTRLIYLVRDPLDRIAAHWIHNWSIRREIAQPAIALRRASTYVDRSRYMFQLDQFLACFPREHVLVLDQRALRDRRIETLQQVFSFVGVDPSFRHPSFERTVHATGGKRRVSPIGAAIERTIRRTPLGRHLPTGAAARVEGLLPGGVIERPDIRAALAPETLAVLREDARRLREFTGLTLDYWTV